MSAFGSITGAIHDAAGTVKSAFTTKNVVTGALAVPAAAVYSGKYVIDKSAPTVKGLIDKTKTAIASNPEIASVASSALGAFGLGNLGGLLNSLGTTPDTGASAFNPTTGTPDNSQPPQNPWLIPAAVGAGVLVLILLLRRK